MPYTPVCLSAVDDIREYIKNVNPYSHNGATVLHHTWSPTSSQWKGKQSMLDAYYWFTSNPSGPRWSHIPCQFWTAPDGVWISRPFSYQNGAHAYVNKDWSIVPKSCRDFCNGNRQALNYYATGVETVGNFDSEDPKTSKSMDFSIELFAAMHDIWNIPLEKLFFHRFVEDKTCPGTKVTYDWFVNSVKERSSGAVPPSVLDEVKIYDMDGNEISGAKGRIESDGRTHGVVALVIQGCERRYDWEDDGHGNRAIRIKE